VDEHAARRGKQRVEERADGDARQHRHWPAEAHPEGEGEQLRLVAPFAERGEEEAGE
jgi:hypothetical protein